MLTFNKLPKVRRDEINLVARIMMTAFKDNGIDTKGIANKIKRNLLYLYNNEQPITDSVFSYPYKLAWKANANEVLNDWDSSREENRILVTGYLCERVDEAFVITPTDEIDCSAPNTTTDIQIISMGVYVKADGTSYVQTDFITNPKIQAINNQVGNVVPSEILAAGGPDALQYLFVIVKGFKKNVPKLGNPVKITPDSKSLDGVFLLPFLA